MELQIEYEKELKNINQPKCSVRELFQMYFDKVGQFTKSKNHIKNHIKSLDKYYDHLADLSVHTPQINYRKS